MTQELESVIRTIRTLSHGEKLTILQIIAEDLHATSLTAETSRFWATPTLEDLITTQQTPIIHDIATLGVDFWPDDETADMINAYIEQQRNEDG
jgi:hypothetical protein